MVDPAFVTPDSVYLQEGGGSWWRLSPEKYQTLTQAAFRREPVGRALMRMGRRVKGLPRGLDKLPADVQSAAIDGVGYVRFPRTAADWRASLLNLDLRPERFTFLSFVFDISKAKRIARRRHMAVLHGIPEEDWWGRGWRDRIRVDPKHLRRDLDLTKPVIRGTLIDEMGSFSLLIDGNHRATLALSRGVEVPHVILTVPDTLDTVTNGGSIYALRTRRLRQQQAAKSRGAQEDG